MLDAQPENPSLEPRDLRARLAADISAGKTVCLSSAELAAPEVRAQLPSLLEELSRTHASTFASPMRVPGYTILGEVGHGGMSTVYLARQQALGRHVAVKIAPKWLGGDRRTQARLLQEARAMARVSHPNVVAIHDILEVDDTIAIAMEWIDGLTLAAILRILSPSPADGDMALIKAALGTPSHIDAGLEHTPVRCFARMLHDIARAVQHVHDAGLLHLDIKPSNVLVRRDGTPLLADFGVVRDMSVEATHTRTFAGTPVYSAPEQLRREDREFGPHTDVYSLGMTLYEALARQQPLQQLGMSRILQDVMSGRVPHLSSRADVPLDLANIVHKAIAPEPRLRYATAAAFADDLLAFLEHRPVTARPLSMVHRLSRWARNEPWKAALAAALALLLPALFVVGGYLLSQLPRIEQTRREEARAEANELKQAAFQAYFVSLRDVGWASRRLRDAMERDPTDSSLACLLAMAHEEQDASLEQVLREQDVAHHPSLGMRLFAGKVAANRAFFDDGEAQQLVRSTDPTDKYVLALDRMFRAEDLGNDEAYAEADGRLEEAAMTVGSDLLLAGLRAWSLRRCRDMDRFEAISRAMAARWPDSLDMLAWRYFALTPHAHQDSLGDIERHLAVQPGAHRGWEILISEAIRENDADGNARTAGLIARAVQSAGASPSLAAFQLLLDARAGGAHGAQRALAQMAPECLTFNRRLSLLRRAGGGALEKFCEQQLAQPRPPWRLLAHVHDDAAERDDTALVRRVWEIWRREYPDRRCLHSRHIRFLYDPRNFAAAAEVAREFVPPSGELASNAIAHATILAETRAWLELRHCATRWRDLEPSQRAQAATYVALAEARLGNPRAAADNLAIALVATPEQGKWYGHALLEDAWLRVDPNGLPELRDPELAKVRLATFDRYMQKFRKAIDGPWAQAVRAEVAFANGDRDGALRAAEAGLRFRTAEATAPDGCLDALKQALKRYRAN